MQQLEQIFTFILENKELFATFLVTLVTILKLTSWGRSEAAALDYAVSKVDPKKETASVAARVAREVLRGFFPPRK